jgi:hypothetical protein
MSAAVAIEPTLFFKERPLYSAKVGTGPSNIVAIKRMRRFWVGQHIEYCEYSELRERGGRPLWHGGRIDEISGNRLFISRW